MRRTEAGGAEAEGTVAPRCSRIHLPRATLLLLVSVSSSGSSRSSGEAEGGRRTATRRGLKGARTRWTSSMKTLEPSSFHSSSHFSSPFPLFLRLQHLRKMMEREREEGDNESSRPFGCDLSANLKAFFSRSLVLRPIDGGKVWTNALLHTSPSSPLQMHLLSSEVCVGLFFFSGRTVESRPTQQL